MTSSWLPISRKSSCTEGKRLPYLLGNSGAQSPSPAPNSCCWRTQSFSLSLHQRPEVCQTDTPWDKKTALKCHLLLCRYSISWETCAMPSSVSGEPNTTPFSAEQKITCSGSSDPNSHRDKWSPKNRISACKDQCPKTLRMKVTRTSTDVRYHKHSQIRHFISPCCTYKGFIILLLTSA